MRNCPEGRFQPINLNAEEETIPMGRFFSDPVERALKYIYYDLRARRGQEGFLERDHRGCDRIYFLVRLFSFSLFSAIFVLSA